MKFESKLYRPSFLDIKSFHYDNHLPIVSIQELLIYSTDITSFSHNFKKLILYKHNDGKSFAKLGNTNIPYCLVRVKLNLHKNCQAQNLNIHSTNQNDNKQDHKKSRHSKSYVKKEHFFDGLLETMGEYLYLTGQASFKDEIALIKDVLEKDRIHSEEFGKFLDRVSKGMEEKFCI